MPDTNPDAVKLLSDDALREIEADEKLQYENDITPHYRMLRDIRALCQTVRALRAESDKQSAFAKANFKEWEKAQTENTALREQLAHWQERTRERTTEVERLQAQLAQVTQALTTIRDCQEEKCRMCAALARTALEEMQPQIPSEQRGLVIMSALINFVDWLEAKDVFDASEKERGELVKRFLAAHSEGENYFMQAEQIAEILGEPFKQEQP